MLMLVWQEHGMDLVDNVMGDDFSRGYVAVYEPLLLTIFLKKMGLCGRV